MMLLKSNALNLLLPARCLCCGEAVAEQGSVCSECWGNLRFLGQPACYCCTQPFEYAIGKNALCAACIASPPAYDRAAAVLRYDAASSSLITRFKYADQIHAAKHYAKWMARSGAELIAEADIITPVPLHRRRLFSRRYNQSALLARALAQQVKLPYVPDVLLRIRHTPPQASLNRSHRQKNLRGAFIPNPKQTLSLKDKNILLIDDVTTTGATLNACARVLKKAGASRVYVVALAKTVIE